MYTLVLTLSGLKCLNCVNKATEALTQVPGASKVKVWKEGSASYAKLTLDPTKLGLPAPTANAQAQATQSQANSHLDSAKESTNELSTDSSQNTQEVQDQARDQVQAQVVAYLTQVVEEAGYQVLAAKFKHQVVAPVANVAQASLTTLTFTKLSCQNCVNKVTQYLTQVPGVTDVKVDLATKTAQVNGGEVEALLQACEAAGYPATASTATSTTAAPTTAANTETTPAQVTTNLAFTKLSCQNCVKKVTQYLTQVPGVTDVKVDLATKTAQVSGGEVDALLQACEDAGYPATVADKAASTSQPAAQANVAPTASSAAAKPTEQAVPASVKAQAAHALVGAETSAASAAAKQDKTSTHGTDKNYHQLLISNMSCASCALKVKGALEDLPGVTAVLINPADNTGLVTGGNAKQILAACEEAGYPAKLLGEDRQAEVNRQLEAMFNQHKFNAILTLVVGGLLMLLHMTGVLPTYEQGQAYPGTYKALMLFVGLVVLGVLYVAGRHHLIAAYRMLQHKQVGMDTLISLGVLTSLGLSFLIILFPSVFSDHHLYLDAGLMIVGFVNIGKAIELRGKRAASSALDELNKLLPDQVTKVEGFSAHAEPQVTVSETESKTKALDTESDTQDKTSEPALTYKQVSRKQISLGDYLLLRTGDKVPVDGVVVQGTAYLDESLLTGEAVPVKRQLEQVVRAGTIVNNGQAIIQATQTGDETLVAQMMEAIVQAQANKPAIAKLADTISQYFVAGVLVLAGITLLGHVLAGAKPQDAFLYASSVLLVSCPCALGLAVPISVSAAISRAAKLGILVQNAQALHKLAQVDVVVFDKTGTLTQGKMKLTSTYVAEDQVLENHPAEAQAQLLAVTAALEQSVNHPIAQALVQAARAENLPLETVEQLTYVAGKGLLGQVAGKYYLVGSLKFCQSLGLDFYGESLTTWHQSYLGATFVGLVELSKTRFNQLVDQVKQNLQPRAEPSLTADDQALLAVYAISDALKAYAKESLGVLDAEYKSRLVMLTGDNPEAAHALAKGLPIDQVVAEATPDTKANLIANFQHEKPEPTVVMVGDGVNDAQAFAKADVSVAMGSGADVTLAVADLTLLNNSLVTLVHAIDLSQAAVRNLHRSLFAAFAYNVVLIPVAMFGGLTPMMAALAMALSSITVAVNASTLQMWQPKHKFA